MNPFQQPFQMNMQNQQPFQMNMQNQFMNINTQGIEGIIQPFKEKIKKLEEELMQKDIEIAKLNYTILQMKQMNQMNLMNNQFNQFNPMNMPMPNYPMFNTMFPAGNQMNMPGNMNMSPIPKKKKKIKRLNLTFKEGGKTVVIQCRSNDKMEEAINIFCTKLNIKKEEYKFIVNGNKVKMNLTIDKNGINNEDQVINVEKKDENDYIEEKNKKDIIEEKNDDTDYEYEDEDEDNKGICNDINVKILGEKIILIFCFLGKSVSIEIGMNNTLSDAAIKFGAKYGISTSKIKNDCKFFFNSRIQNIENRQTLKEIGIKNGNRIEVIEPPEVIGA